MKLKPYPKMKDSGIEWIGNIPEHWDVGPFKFCLKKNNGGVWGNDPIDDGDNTLVMRSTEIDLNGDWKIENPAYRLLSTKEKNSTLLQEGDVLIVKSSGSEHHLGKTARVTKEIEKLNCCFSNFLQRIKLNNEQCMDFWFYFLNSIGREQMLFYGTTTTGLKNINSQTINSINTPLLLKQEQKKISQFLDKEILKINFELEKNYNLIESLKEKRQVTIDHLVTKGLDPTVSMKDSGIKWIGKIPEHWQLITLDKKGRIIDPHPNHRNPPFENDGIPFIGIGDLDDYGNITHIGHTVNMEIYEEHRKRYSINENDIGIGRVGTIGKIVRLKNSPKYCLSGRIALIKSSRDNSFLYYSLLSSFFQHQIKLDTDSTTLGVLGIQDLRKIKITRTNLKEEEQISKFLDRHIIKIEFIISKITSQIEKLQEFRQSLISSAVTGKIDVRTIT